jgi:hypothetical protein
VNLGKTKTAERTQIRILIVLNAYYVEHNSYIHLKEFSQAEISVRSVLFCVWSIFFVEIYNPLTDLFNGLSRVC